MLGGGCLAFLGQKKTPQKPVSYEIAQGLVRLRVDGVGSRSNPGNEYPTLGWQRIWRRGPALFCMAPVLNGSLDDIRTRLGSCEGPERSTWRK